MPIESEIPVEIEKYEKKIAFGLTARQLIFLPLALALAVGSYFVCTLKLKLSTDTTSWVVILLAMPMLALGFVRPHGEPFEQFVRLKIRQYLWRSHLYYAAHPTPFEPVVTNTTSQKGGDKRVPDQTSQAAECTRLYRTDARQWKRKRKQTAQRIKAAKKEYRQAKARARRAERASGRKART